MMVNTRLKLRGYQDAKLIDEFIATQMVDIAYVDEITPDAMFLVPDNFDMAKEFDWVREILTSLFETYGILGIEISLEQPPPQP